MPASRPRTRRRFMGLSARSLIAKPSRCPSIFLAAHRRASFSLAQAAELVLELSDKLIEGVIHGLLHRAAAAGGGDCLQSGHVGFDRTLFIAVAPLVRILVRKM